MLHTHFKRRMLSNTHTLYVASFILGVNTALISFVHANFLGDRGLSEHAISVLYILSSLFGIITYITLPIILKQLGLVRTTIYAVSIGTISTISVTWVHCTAVLLFWSLLILATPLTLYYILDILLESETHLESQTGNERSDILTAMNASSIIAPFIAGVVIQVFGYAILYASAAMVLVPFLLLLYRHFSTFSDPAYHRLKIHTMLRTLRASAQMRNVFIIHTLLGFFYAWMIIYMPLYLHRDIGFTLSATGLIFSVMLLPFLILEYPLGHWGDKSYGERGFLVAGFIIMSLSTYALSYVTEADIALWMLLLFVTRIGAATVEVMNEIYFFKLVDADDTDSISAFRMLYSIAFALGPALGAVLLLFIPMQILFGILGIIMLAGILASLRLQ